MFLLTIPINGVTVGERVPKAIGAEARSRHSSPQIPPGDQHSPTPSAGVAPVGEDLGKSVKNQNQRIKVKNLKRVFLKIYL